MNRSCATEKLTLQQILTGLNFIPASFMYLQRQVSHINMFKSVVDLSALYEPASPVVLIINLILTHVFSVDDSSLCHMEARSFERHMRNLILFYRRGSEARM